jgi:hypothetical protein
MPGAVNKNECGQAFPLNWIPALLAAGFKGARSHTGAQHLSYGPNCNRINCSALSPCPEGPAQSVGLGPLPAAYRGPRLAFWAPRIRDARELKFQAHRLKQPCTATVPSSGTGSTRFGGVSFSPRDPWIYGDDVRTRKRCARVTCYPVRPCYLVAVATHRSEPERCSQFLTLYCIH